MLVGAFIHVWHKQRWRLEGRGAENSLCAIKKHSHVEPDPILSA